MSRTTAATLIFLMKGPSSVVSVESKATVNLLQKLPPDASKNVLNYLSVNDRFRNMGKVSKEANRQVMEPIRKAFENELDMLIKNFENEFSQQKIEEWREKYNEAQQLQDWRERNTIIEKMLEKLWPHVDKMMYFVLMETKLTALAMSYTTSEQWVRRKKPEHFYRAKLDEIETDDTFDDYNTDKKLTVSEAIINSELFDKLKHFIDILVDFCNEKGFYAKWQFRFRNSESDFPYRNPMFNQEIDAGKRNLEKMITFYDSDSLARNKLHEGFVKQEAAGQARRGTPLSLAIFRLSVKGGNTKRIRGRRMRGQKTINVGFYKNGDIDRGFHNEYGPGEYNYDIGYHYVDDTQDPKLFFEYDNFRLTLVKGI